MCQTNEFDAAEPDCRPARRQRPESVGRLQAVPEENSPAQIAVLDPAGVIVAVNRAWTRHAHNLGSTPGGGIGTNYLAVVRVSAEAGHAGAAEAEIGLRQVLAGETGAFNLQYCRPGEREQQCFCMQVAPLPEAAGAVVSHLNITDRKRHESALQQTSADMQNLLGELQQAQSRLLQSAQMAPVGQLAAGMAHESHHPIGYLYSKLRALEHHVADLIGVVAAYERSEPAIDPLVFALAGGRQESGLAPLRTDVASLLAESRECARRVRKIMQQLVRRDEYVVWQRAN